MASQNINQYYRPNWSLKLNLDSSDMSLTSDEQDYNQEVVFSPYLIAQTYGDRLPIYFDINNPLSVQNQTLLYKQYNNNNIFVSQNYYNPNNEDLTCYSSSTSCDIGLTGIDNGLVDQMTGETITFTKGLYSDYLKFNRMYYDRRLKLHQVTGHTMSPNVRFSGFNKTVLYEVVSKSSPFEGRYHELYGGFYQGFYKLFGFDYEIFPERMNKGWSVEMVLKPRLFNEHTPLPNETTLNEIYPNNKNTFFYFGTRAENKFYHHASGSPLCFSGYNRVTSGLTELQTCSCCNRTITDSRCIFVYPPRSVNNIHDPHVNYGCGSCKGDPQKKITCGCDCNLDPCETCGWECQTHVCSTVIEPNPPPPPNPTPTSTPSCFIDNCSSCGPSYSAYNETTCYSISSIPATPPSNPYTLVPSQYFDRSQFGTYVYNPGYTVSGYTNSITDGLYTIINTPFLWKNTTSTNASGPMNRCGLWVNGGGQPFNTWVGFSVCLDVSTTKTYYIGIAGDNHFKLTLDGTVIVNTRLAISQWYGSNLPFKRWNVYPITINSGPHTLELFGWNNESVAGFGCEIYNNTLNELIAASTLSDLNIIFTSSGITSANVIQDSYNEYLDTGFSCPDGYVYNHCTNTCEFFSFCYACPPPTPSPTPTPIPDCELPLVCSPSCDVCTPTTTCYNCNTGFTSIENTCETNPIYDSMSNALSFRLCGDPKNPGIGVRMLKFTGDCVTTGSCETSGITYTTGHTIVDYCTPPIYPTCLLENPAWLDEEHWFQVDAVWERYTWLDTCDLWYRGGLGDITEKLYLESLANNASSLITVPYTQIDCKPSEQIELVRLNEKWLIDKLYRNGRLKIYVNGKLFHTIENFEEIIPRGLDTDKEKQVGVPFNISWGGGTQGLRENLTFSSITQPYGPYIQDPENFPINDLSGTTFSGLKTNILIEQNFAGTFDGAISQFRMYVTPLSAPEVKHNFNLLKNIFRMFNPDCPDCSTSVCLPNDFTYKISDETTTTTTTTNLTTTTTTTNLTTTTTTQNINCPYVFFMKQGNNLCSNIYQYDPINNLETNVTVPNCSTYGAPTGIANTNTKLWTIDGNTNNITEWDIIMSPFSSNYVKTITTSNPFDFRTRFISAYRDPISGLVDPNFLISSSSSTIVPQLTEIIKINISGLSWTKITLFNWPSSIYDNRIIKKLMMTTTNKIIILNYDSLTSDQFITQLEYVGGIWSLMLDVNITVSSVTYDTIYQNSSSNYLLSDNIPADVYSINNSFSKTFIDQLNISGVYFSSQDPNCVNNEFINGPLVTPTPTPTSTPTPTPTNTLTPTPTPTPTVYTPGECIRFIDEGTTCSGTIVLPSNINPSPQINGKSSYYFTYFALAPPTLLMRISWDNINNYWILEDMTTYYPLPDPLAYLPINSPTPIGSMAQWVALPSLIGSCLYGGGSGSGGPLFLTTTGIGDCSPCCKTFQLYSGFGPGTGSTYQILYCDNTVEVIDVPLYVTITYKCAINVIKLNGGGTVTVVDINCDCDPNNLN